MPLLKTKTSTLQDIYTLPDGQRAELLHGRLYMMAPPNTTHQRLVHMLAWTIENYIRANQGICEVFPAPFAVFLNADEETYVEPDLSIVCDPKKIDEKGCQGAPDWIIEIVSPSSRKMDYYIKLSEYSSAGVREYWIADPVKKIILVYDLEQEDAPVLYHFSDTVKVRIYEDFEIDFSQISETG